MKNKETLGLYRNKFKGKWERERGFSHPEPLMASSRTCFFPLTGIRKRKGKNEISFLPYLYVRTLFSSLWGCFSFAFSSWILSFPSCQKETFTCQSDHINSSHFISATLQKETSHWYLGNTDLTDPLWTWRCVWTLENIQSPVHPKSSFPCFSFAMNTVDFTF